MTTQIRTNGRLLRLVLVSALVACASAPPSAGTGATVPTVTSAGRGVPAAAGAVASSDYRIAVDPQQIERMIREGTGSSHVTDDLRYLLDVIGPRLAGSAGMQRANEWTARKFREYGADSAWLESFPFGIGWERGPMTLRLLLPQQRQLIGVSWAWSPGTNGALAGDVVLIDDRTEAQYMSRHAGRLRGAWVLVGPAASVRNPDGPPLTAADSVRLDSLRRAQQRLTEDERRFQSLKFALLAQEGIAGVIRDGAKEFGLLTMSGSPDAISPYPQVVIGNGDYAQLERLVRRGERVRLEANIQNQFTRDTLQQRNTVAELRGTEHPDEIVLLGAHLDSWDLATGATDNATGSIAVLEAARILAASGVRPKRTIRFALFGAEEEGLYGSEAYAAAHAAELQRFQAVLVLDNGTGRISGIALQGRDELRPLWEELFRPLSSLGPFAVRSGNKGGTDHLSFLPYAVPAFNFDQLTRGYNHTHHSQVDVFDQAVPVDVMQAATVMAVAALQLANLSELLPRANARTQ